LKIDQRALDVGLAVWYFCVSWEGAADGRLRLGEARTFLTAYQRRLQEESDCPPLSAVEIRYLPHLINAGKIYVVYWTPRDSFGKSADPTEYLVYLQHGVAFARWFDRPVNWLKLEAMLAGLPHP